MFVKIFKKINFKDYLRKIGITFSVFATALLVVVIFTPLANWLAPLFFVEPNIKKVDAIVVLSGGAYSDGSLTLFTIGREVEGILLYKEGWAKKIIFVGNSGNHKISDAQKMKELAVTLGIPEKDILVEPNSVDTYGNLQEVVEIMKNNNLRTGLLVTSSVHTKRSLLVAKKLGMEIFPASTSVDKYRRVSVDRLILFWFEVRETIALVVYRFKGLI